MHPPPLFVFLDGLVLTLTIAFWTKSEFSSVLQHEQQAHSGVHILPSAKHSQYIFRHFVFLHVHPFFFFLDWGVCNWIVLLKIIFRFYFSWISAPSESSWLRCSLMWGGSRHVKEWLGMLLTVSISWRVLWILLRDGRLWKISSWSRGSKLKLIFD